MKMPMRGFPVLGYDRFKQSHVKTTVTSMDDGDEPVRRRQDHFFCLS